MLKVRRLPRMADRWMFVWGLALSMVWMFQGHDRDSLLLAAITYWGMPWTGSNKCD